MLNHLQMPQNSFDAQDEHMDTSLINISPQFGFGNFKMQIRKY